MAKKNLAKRPRTVNQQLTSLERLVRAGFRQTDARSRQIDTRYRQADVRLRGLGSELRSFQRRTDQRFRGLTAELRSFQRRADARFQLVHLEFRNLRKELNERFTFVDERISRLATHVDGFMKLHETLDIELRVMKEQMRRFEERLSRVEAAQTI